MKTIETRALCRQRGRYLGWPGITRAPNGIIYVAFSGDRDAHVCPFGKVFLMSSNDQGETWSEAREVINTPLDDRDAGILACADGTLLLNWFTLHMTEDRIRNRTDDPKVQRRWIEQVRGIDESEVERWTQPNMIETETGRRGHWIARSSDGGSTWPDKIPVGISSTNPPIQCADGRVLYLGNSSFDRQGRRGHLSVMESRDSGRTWSEIAAIDMFTEYTGSDPNGVSYMGEPTILETADGSLLAAARHQLNPYEEKPENCRIWTFRSADGGRTWTEPKPTEVVGKPPHLSLLSDGRVLLSYGYRFSPYGIRACLSEDGGRSWDYENELVLRADGVNDDLGYPQSLQVDDGSILTVYYQVEKEGEMPTLFLTRWRE